MSRRVDVGTGVAAEVKVGNIELGLVRIALARSVVVHHHVDLRFRQAGIGLHAGDNRMAQLDESRHCRSIWGNGERMGSRRTLADVSPGMWIQERLWSWGPGSSRQGVAVGCIVPEGFEAYARVLHPPTAKATWRPFAGRRWRPEPAPQRIH